MSDWISVNDALPDKKVIATYLNRIGNRRTIIATYAPKYGIVADPDDDCNHDYCEEKDEFYWAEGWYEQQDNWGEYAAIFVTEGEVDYWMPLPQPPETQNDNQNI